MTEARLRSACRVQARYGPDAWSTCTASRSPVPSTRRAIPAGWRSWSTTCRPASTVFMRHVTLPTELMGAAQLRMWMAWQRAGRAADVVSPFPPDAPQSRLIPELSPNPHEAVIDKVTMSAFEGTPLDIVLRDCGITAVAIVGVALEVGIEPTARHAADLGYIPIVVTDACGAGDAAAGERALATLEFAGDAVLTDVAGFTRAVANRAETG